jgi:hypothetical protein
MEIRKAAPPDRKIIALQRVTLCLKSLSLQTNSEGTNDF